MRTPSADVAKLVVGARLSASTRCGAVAVSRAATASTAPFATADFRDTGRMSDTSLEGHRGARFALNALEGRLGEYWSREILICNRPGSERAWTFRRRLGAETLRSSTASRRHACVRSG